MCTRSISITFLLALLFVFSPYVTKAQAPVYKPFEVDSVATPRGGQAMLETFLAANLQKPFMAQVANVIGRVHVTAVVKPTGHVSDVQIVRGLRPDCDQEALRVMRLFSGWKPAQKEGKFVRQVVSYSILFRANAPIRFENGALVEQFDEKFNLISSPQQVAKAVYQQHTPVDTLTSLPNGDLTLFRIKEGGKLEEVVKIPLVKLKVEAKTDGELTYRLGHKDPTSDWVGTIYTLRADGSVARRAAADMRTGQAVSYNKQGMVTSSSQRDEPASTTTWQSNGLLHQIETTYMGDRKELQHRTQLMAAWDSTGRQLIKDGNGYYTRVISKQSRQDTTQKTRFVEAGNIRDGFKDGQWTGHYADGSYSYTEQYRMGEDLGGVATLPGGKQISYKEAMQNPKFVGGQEGMYSFLNRTVMYPADAARKKVSGKVYVAFTVCTDGSLCDYEVLKGVYPSLDAEAIRATSKMPNWLPGLYRGEPARIKYNLPVSFLLE